ncbi:MAG: hypothetical protein ABUT39_21215 [Acidobacteriota bacterium]
MAQDQKKVRQTEDPEDELHRLIDGLQRKIGPVDPRALASDVNRTVREVRKRNASRPS